jgi:hypothetical protein
LSRSVPGSSRSTANTFATLRYVNRKSMRRHPRAAPTGAEPTAHGRQAPAGQPTISGLRRRKSLTSADAVLGRRRVV